MRLSPGASLTSWSLGALVAGLLLGWIGYTVGHPAFGMLASVLEPVGSLWLSALQATVLPMVVVHMVGAVVGVDDRASVGSLGLRAVLLIIALLIGAGVFTVLVAPAVIAQFPIDRAALASLESTLVIPEAARAAAQQSSTALSLGEWVSNLLPSNIFAAAANGDILALLLFAALFGAAINHIPGSQRRVVAATVHGLGSALLVLVKWVLWFTPPGVFAFAYLAALGVGGIAAGMLGAFALVTSVMLVLATLLLYPLTSFFARVPMRTFARACVPAQLVAISTRSSIASLPALIAGARDTLRLPPVATAFLLPLCSSLFKMNRTVSSTTKLMFLAAVYGVSLDAWTMVTFIAIVTVLSFSGVGVPGGGGAFRTLPAYLAAGIPLEGLVLVEAVDAIPDLFKTTLNVTGHMTVATILSPRVPATSGALPIAQVVEEAPDEIDAVAIVGAGDSR